MEGANVRVVFIGVDVHDMDTTAGEVIVVIVETMVDDGTVTTALGSVISTLNDVGMGITDCTGCTAG